MTSTLPVASQRAPLSVYIELRDGLWHALMNQVVSTRRELAILDLANKVVLVFLNAQAGESLGRTVELLRCQTCELFIARSEKNLNPPPYPIDIPFCRASLEAALSDEEPLPAPVPSSHDDLEPGRL